VALLPTPEVAASFNYCIDTQKERLRDRNAQRLRRLEINHQLKFYRLLDGHFCGPTALQYLDHEERTPAKYLGTIGAVRHQAADFGKRPRLSCRRQTVLERKLGDIFGRQTPVHNDGTDSLLFHAREY
jgi:hypothetical protein